jgi:hypothetical protein
LHNPDRPSEPSPGQIARMDEEAMIGLENIKRNVEKRFLLQADTCALTGPALAAIIAISVQVAMAERRQ